MGENSKIQWCDHTFNPWIGCRRVSPACDHCYAAASTPARAMKIEWDTDRRHRTTESNWRLPLRWNKKAEAEGRRYRVFCASLADVFDNEVDPSWRSDLFKLIEKTPHLDWLLLTKRIGNVKKLCGGISAWPNVWLGATVVTQEEADRDVPKLLATPARVRFLSCEPLLGPIDFRWTPYAHKAAVESYREYLERKGSISEWEALRKLDWIIVGGESGPKARPMAQQWVEQIRWQCQKAGVAFFMKQGSEANWPAYDDFDRFGDSVRVREWPTT